MLTDSLVAINIIKEKENEKELLNKSSVPLLFYWNGEDDIILNLKNDNEFKSYISSILNNFNDYIDTKISFFYFTYDNGEENYNESEKKLQEFISLNDFESDSLILTYLISCFKKLYFSGFKYEYNSILTDNNDIIVDIYTLLKNKFQKRISKKTVINWIRSVLVKNNLTTYNTNYICSSLEKILKNVD